MGITHVEDQVLALKLGTIAGAHDLQLLLEAGGHAHHHVVDEAPGQTMQGPMGLVVAGTLDGEDTVVLLDLHIRVHLL